MDNQTPFIPISNGNTKTDITINTKVLRKDIIADILPLERAVNNADVKRFNPINKNEIEKSFKPILDNLYTLVPLLVNIETNKSDFNNPNINTRIDVTIIPIKLSL